MKLLELIKIANTVYPDDLIIQHFDADTGKPVNDRTAKNIGDGLAHFIVRELYDTYDAKATKEKQLLEAYRVMSRASKELGAVAYVFNA